MAISWQQSGDRSLVSEALMGSVGARAVPGADA